MKKAMITQGNKVTFINLIIRHFLGLPNSKSTSKKSASISSIIDTIIDYENCIKGFILKNGNGERTREYYITELGNLLEKSELFNQAFTEEDLYSRIINVNITSNKIVDIIFIICLYILRGHCSFWKSNFEIEELGQDISTTKESLNDFHQANYLLNRLEWQLIDKDYYAVNSKLGNSKKRNEEIINKFIKDNNSFREIKKTTLKVEDLINCLRIIVNCHLGSTFCELHYCYEALDYFKKVLHLYDGNSNVDQLIYKPCKLLAKTRFEVGKIHIHIGNFLEGAIFCYIALSDLIIMSGDNKRAEHLYNQIINPLQSMNKYDNIEKKQIYKIMSALQPKPFKDNNIIADEYICLANEIFARIGFIHHFIFTNRYHCIERSRSGATSSNRLMHYFTPWNLNKNKNAFWFSSMGRYCLNSFKGQKEDYSKNDKYGALFPDEPERLLAYHASHEFKSMIEATDPKLRDICLFLGKVAMNEITNVMTAHHIIQGFLFKGGYKSRMRDKINDKKWNVRMKDGSHQRNVYGPYINKFVILRRFQSFNPKVPRPRIMKIHGGGYYLFWQGKGTVIDPGYDFLVNFFAEGFGLDDIDAVIVTHSHPDHDDELSTILTLIAEKNDFWAKNFRGYKNAQTLDLFLNEGSYRKYVNWIYSPKIAVNKIFQLQLTVKKQEIEKGLEREVNKWVRLSNKQDDTKGNINHVVMDFSKKYNYQLEVIPAWHDEIISQHASIGVKFHLQNGKKNYILGITSDTSLYDGINDEYKNCDILVAHLGDLKAAELISEPLLNKIINSILERTKGEYLQSDKDTNRVKTIKKYKKFLELIESLDLVDNHKLSKDDIMQLEQILTKDINKISNEDIKKLDIAINKLINTYEKFKYENHLGIKGVYELFRSIYDSIKTNRKNKLLIIGEFPEELGSYRHMIARILNESQGVISKCNRGGKQYPPEWKVRCLTGDIGLHVGIGINLNNKSYPLTIRCYRCNQNNESIAECKHYHSPAEIQETLIKAVDQSMVYLCTRYDHAMLPLNEPKWFISRMGIRSIR